MKPKIKEISVDCREWADGGFHRAVYFSRWTGFGVGEEQFAVQNSTYSRFYEPTPASIARCRRAQDKMAGADVEIFGQSIEIASERERCAKIAETMPLGNYLPDLPGTKENDMRWKIIEAIRGGVTT
jgi:hypothetical protein